MRVFTLLVVLFACVLIQQSRRGVSSDIIRHRGSFRCVLSVRLRCGVSLASAVSVGAGPVLVGGPAPSAVAVAVALVVSLATAGIAVGVVLSGSRGNRRVGGATASLDCKVVVDSLLHSALLSLAAVSPKPGIVGAPVADGEGHTISEVAEQLGSAVLSHPDAFSVLAKGDAEVTAGANIHSDVDVFISVDLEVVAGTVSVVVEDVFSVEPAVTTPVAVAVVPLAVGGIARVGGSLPGVQVSLLDIELRAPVASTLVAVTVVISVSIPEVT
jgi:hypothetical protein